MPSPARGSPVLVAARHSVPHSCGTPTRRSLSLPCCRSSEKCVAASSGLPRKPTGNGEEIEPGGSGAAVAPGNLDVDDVRAAGGGSFEAAIERAGELCRILDALRLDAVGLGNRRMIDLRMVERAAGIPPGRRGSPAVLMQELAVRLIGAV